ncbi:MAG: exodeoxyribonuclease VII large subunit [Blastocatellia bacterium]
MPRRTRPSNLTLSLFAENPVLSVSKLTADIKTALEADFHDLYVQGEISNFKKYPSGHWYFTLKDEQAQISAVFFRNWNRLLRFAPENGLEVRVRGRLSVWEKSGNYQLNVESMEPVGVGALQLAYEQLARKLQEEGLFDEERKRPLPVLPRKIGIVTSPQGAVIRDMLNILGRRNASIDVLLAPVRVQGAGAAVEIAQAIKTLSDNAARFGIDAIIVGRGGGSAEDLWAFNEEIVARAIHAAKVPVVSAIGHETDVTIADWVADMRAPTPSAAAELVGTEAEELRAHVEGLLAHLGRAMDYYLLQRRHELRDLIESQGFAETIGTVIKLGSRVRELELRASLALKNNLHRAKLRVESAARHLTSADWRAPMAVAEAQLQIAHQRLERAMQAKIERKWHQLSLTSGKMEMLSPLSVLSRGYTIVRDEAGQLIPNGATLRRGQKVTLRFEDGDVGCQVIEPLK